MGLNSNHKCPYQGKAEGALTAKRKRWCDDRSRDWSDALWRWSNRPQAKEYGWLLEVEKVKENILPSDSRTVREDICIAVNHYGGYALLQ